MKIQTQGWTNSVANGLSSFHGFWDSVPLQLEFSGISFEQQ